MCRVWREGQKKNVFIYRFVSTGTIEEKILQRQMVKTGLSKTVVDDRSLKAAFSKEMLKSLFVYNEGLSRAYWFLHEIQIVIVIRLLMSIRVILQRISNK